MKVVSYTWFKVKDFKLCRKYEGYSDERLPNFIKLLTQVRKHQARKRL